MASVVSPHNQNVRVVISDETLLSAQSNRRSSAAFYHLACVESKMLQNFSNRFLSSVRKYSVNRRRKPVPGTPSDQVEPIAAVNADPNGGPSQEANNQEKSDDYSKVVIRLNDHWRVVECRDGIQWILQSRKGSHKGKTAWRARSFCRSKICLCRDVREKVGEISDEAQQQLGQLPDRIEQ